MHVCMHAHTHTHTHTNGIVCSHKRNAIMPFVATWVDLEIVILNEVNQKRERQMPHDITYMWNLKYDVNEHIYKTETDSQTDKKFVVAKGVCEKDALVVCD